jgi:peptide/nickel transport system ATP-binding protein
MTTPAGAHLIKLRNLTIRSHARQLVSGIDLDCYEGRVTALMGPSGSGKSLTARAVMGCLDVNPGLVDGSLHYPAVSDRDWYQGVRGGGMRAQRRLLKATATLRGSYFTYSPQAASSALNPGRTLGQQLALAVRRRQATPADLGRAIRDLLTEVGLAPSDSRLLPAEMSGGMCQRAALAIAVAPLPRLVIADEPETGLDPVLTRGVIELMVDVCREHHCGLLLISHHQQTVDKIADDVVHLPGVEVAA